MEIIEARSESYFIGLKAAYVSATMGMLLLYILLVLTCNFIVICQIVWLLDPLKVTFDFWPKIDPSFYLFTLNSIRHIL